MTESVSEFLLRHHREVSHRLDLCQYFNDVTGDDLFPTEIIDQMRRYLERNMKAIEQYQRTGMVNWDEIRDDLKEVIEMQRTYVAILELEESVNG